ncbi:hypothetical protein [Bradyrhizobium sp. SZCCHNR1053]|uniref:hypothetical protein n=1 Tax=unclassified Bradyrhizobium TaxID=2631580 RepID=UPI00396570B1
MKLQRCVIERGQRILVIIEGRDAAGKDGTIKSIVEPLSPRDTRVVAPSNREQCSWYFQRHVSHLPAAGEIVLFNRSLYKRAGVESIMGFCTKEETEEFLEIVPAFEAMIERSGITLLKYYLDISKQEQWRRSLLRVARRTGRRAGSSPILQRMTARRRETTIA